MAGRKRFFVTTPIYYVNDVPHIGHAYTTVAADCLARYKRLEGEEVFFLTGTDEHGQKVEKTAREAGETPQQLADRVVVRFQKLWERLTISHTDFIRTTEGRHKKAVKALFLTIAKKGDIYKGEYEDWYCVPCETFLQDIQLSEGKCPTCGRPVEKLKEESYFFRMSRYQERLLRYIRSHPDFIQPKTRRNEIVSFVKGGLHDLSISRTAFRWGIPVPTDETHVIYVWFDALVNYLTAIGYPDDQKRFTRFWPADLHIIGKDILRFHAVYWPTFLMSAGLLLPRRIFSHGWWTVEGEKMSKSKGNVVDPNEIIDEFGADPFRYFLLREVPFGLDGDFSREALIGRINSELANDLGNLLSRALTMIERYSGGRIPSPHSRAITKEEDRIKKAAGGLSTKVSGALERLEFHSALKEIFGVVDLVNRYIEKSAPWNLAKDHKKQGRLNTVLYTVAEALRIISLYLSPFMPSAASEMARQIGIDIDVSSLRLATEKRWGGLKPGTLIRKGAPLFPRKEERKATTGTDLPKQQEKETPMAQIPEAARPGLITLEDFSRIDLRVGKIIAAEKIPGSTKLLTLSVDVGRETRQLVAGIATHYSPEGLIGKKVVVVANLTPATIFGVESQGMILAAGEKEVEGLAIIPEEVPPGTRVK